MTIKEIFILISFMLLAGCNKKSSIDSILSTANYDEAKVPPYELPNPLICSDGTEVINDSMWWHKRRPELLSLFENQMYGKTPSKADDSLFFTVHKINQNALSGKAVMTEIDIFFSNKRDSNSMRILLVTPKKNHPVPCFVSLNFKGNMGISTDTFISMNTRWMVYNEFTNPVPVAERIRGKNAHRWPLEMIIDSGYALATAYYGDIDPDYDDNFQNGIHPFYYRKGQTKPDSGEWGSIGAWAWGLSRIADYLQHNPAIDTSKLIVMGHSRLGKTALWAGAQDTRFDIVISNNSGCGGAALSKRIFGETPYILNEIRPQWFCDNFVKYNHHEEMLAFDQHELIALIAPRPVYVASASNDLPADPKGEFLSLVYADTVYRMLGTTGLSIKEMPEAECPIMGTMGYHLRKGDHDITSYDWYQYIRFANYHFNKRK